MSRVSDSMPLVRRRWRLLFTITLVVAFVIFVNYFVQWLGLQLQLEVRPSNEHMIHRIIIISIVAYTLLIAIPFVPSVEIGLGLILLLGADLAPLVYLFTIVGLSLGFIVGRLIPEASLQKFLEDLSLTRASRLVETLKAMSTDERLEMLVSRAPARFVPTLVRHRYVLSLIHISEPTRRS